MILGRSNHPRIELNTEIFKFNIIFPQSKILNSSDITLFLSTWNHHRTLQWVTNQVFLYLHKRIIHIEGVSGGRVLTCRDSSWQGLVAVYINRNRCYSTIHVLTLLFFFNLFFKNRSLLTYMRNYILIFIIKHFIIWNLSTFQSKFQTYFLIEKSSTTTKTSWVTIIATSQLCSTL